MDFHILIIIGGFIGVGKGFYWCICFLFWFGWIWEIGAWSWVESKGFIFFAWFFGAFRGPFDWWNFCVILNIIIIIVIGFGFDWTLCFGFGWLWLGRNFWSVFGWCRGDCIWGFCTWNCWWNLIFCVGCRMWCFVENCLWIMKISFLWGFGVGLDRHIWIYNFFSFLICIFWQYYLVLRVIWDFWGGIGDFFGINYSCVLGLNVFLFIFFSFFLNFFLIFCMIIIYNKLYIFNISLLLIIKCE